MGDRLTNIYIFIFIIPEFICSTLFLNIDFNIFQLKSKAFALSETECYDSPVDTLLEYFEVPWL